MSCSHLTIVVSHLFGGLLKGVIQSGKKVDVSKNKGKMAESTD